MTVELKDVALAFCKEVLAWPDAQHDSFDYVKSMAIQYLPDRLPTDDSWKLDYRFLDEAIRPVKKWCDRNKYGFQVAYHGTSYIASVYPLTASSGEEGDAVSGGWEAAEPCEALLAACLSAHRKRQAAKG